MDLASLEILVAAVEEKSLSRAAERVHLVTSAASKRISELERRLLEKRLESLLGLYVRRRRIGRHRVVRPGPSSDACPRARSSRTS